MQNHSTPRAWPVIVCALAVLPGWAQQPTPAFAAPVRLHAGDKLLGENRLYPSPVFHDMDGDGHLDVVVGDLAGRLTWARRLPGAAIAFGPEQKVMAVGARELKFHNW